MLYLFVIVHNYAIFIYNYFERGDKDKHQLHVEIDLLSNQCEQANKARVTEA